MNNVMQKPRGKEDIKKLFNKKTVSAAVVALAIIIIGAFILKYFSVNKYNQMGYINTSGKTIGELANEQGISLKKFLEKYELPKNMRADTEEAAAYYSIPTWKIAEMSGKSFEDFKKLYGWNDDILPDTPWGHAQDETLLKYMYSSEKALESFKEQYDLGDEVTGETKYKVVRDIVAENNPDLGKLR